MWETYSSICSLYVELRVLFQIPLVMLLVKSETPVLPSNILSSLLSHTLPLPSFVFSERFPPFGTRLGTCYLCLNLPFL